MMKIINSVVVVGLYYGFLTTFSIGPSSILLLRDRVMEEGTEKEISATTGFITGQLVMFISIYYAPLHLALGKPHTITVLVLPYLLFHFFWNNHKNFFDYGSITKYGSTTKNSMRNLSISCVFLNNLIFQLCNHFILPSSALSRLVNIYMFRCNNKILFVTSGFVGWLMGHILFIKWVEFVLFWIRQNHFIRSNKYLVSELKNYLARIFSILLFITCIYYLGRMPFPIVTNKISETEEKRESEEESDVETTYQKKTEETEEELEEYDEELEESDEEPEESDEELQVIQYKMENLGEKNLYRCTLEFKNRKKRDLFWFEKPLVTFFFDYKRWSRSLLKTERFETIVPNEVSQHFFYTCPSDGKPKISFTYPPSLSTFSEMIERKISLYMTEKQYHENNDLYNHWVSANEQKKNNLGNELINRIKTLEKQTESFVLDVLEKRTRLYNDENEEGYLPKKYDPFLNGPYRGKIEKLNSFSIEMNDLITSTQNSIKTAWINKILGIFPKNPFINFVDGKSLSTYIDNSLNSTPPIIDSKNKTKFLKFVFNVVTNDPNDETIRNNKFVTIKEISKKVPRSHKLTTIFELLEIDGVEDDENPGESETGYPIRSRKARPVIIYTERNQHTNDDDPVEEVYVIRYSQQSDFRRDLIMGSMRAQRRKTIIWKIFQANAHSPLFLDQIDKTFFFPFDFSKMRNPFFWNSYCKEKETEESLNGLDPEIDPESLSLNRSNQQGLIISEIWDNILFAQPIRGLLLLTQSIFRKYITLPFLIIIKNIGRILLYQPSEWDEDFRDWNKEIHVKCTYNGVQLSETEFPKDWLTDGIQIKILFPFRLKPWQGAKIRSHHRDTKPKQNHFYFLTIWGTETETLFGSPRKESPFFDFFEPIFKELKKKFLKEKKSFLTIVKKKIKIFISTSNEKTKWVVKIILIIKRIMKELEKIKLIFLFELNKIKGYAPIENNKNSLISSNKNTQELVIGIQSTNWANYSRVEKKMKDLVDRTITTRNQIEQIKKEKQKIVRTSDRDIISPNKTNFNDKKSKNIWQIFKRGNIRLLRKLRYFLKSFIERVYIDIFIYIINILRINVQIFIESIKKKINNSIYNDKTNQEELSIDETNQNKMQFIFTINKSFSNISKKNANPYCNLPSLSQAYVFYKISQTQVSNKYCLRSVLQYNGTHLFLKDGIKDYCETQGIFDSKSKHKKIDKSGTNEWKNWLKGHYQYNLTQTKWSQLVPQKWRKGVNQYCTIQNKDSIKWDSYKKEKDPLINYVKQKYDGMDSLMDQKEKWKKNYRYDLLVQKYISHKYINYKNKRDSYIYGSPLEINENQEIRYPYNFNIWKPQLLMGINIDTWTNMCTGTNINQNTKARTNSYKKIYNKDILSLTIHQKKIKKSKPNPKILFFDWMGMNQEKLYPRISNLEPRFFPEFGILYDTYNAYKIKPWIIPIKLLLDVNKNSSQNKNTNGNQKKDPYILSNNKEDFELENGKQEKKQQLGQADLGSKALNRKKRKNIEEDYTKLNIKKHRKKKQYKNKKATELEFFLKKHFLFQVRWDDSLPKKITKNIWVYCFVLRMVNPKEITIASIKRGEMNLDVMLIEKDLSFTELINKGILILEPIRLSIEWDEKFILYQIMGISLLNKNKYQTNRKYVKKKYVDTNYFEKSITQRHHSIFVNKNKNHYDFLVPEHILSTRHRRKLRILNCLNSWNRNVVNGISPFVNENSVKNCGQFMNEDKYLHTNINNLIKLKLFIWPNYRLEDLACMNRYWFNTNNGSRFTMSRIHMYPRFQIN